MTEQVPGRAISHVNSGLVNNWKAGSVFETDQTSKEPALAAGMSLRWVGGHLYKQQEI